MVDNEMFSALRVRRRLEDIARTIAEARVSGDVYVSIDTVENALLAMMDEIDEIARAVADAQAVARERDRRGAGWLRRLTPFRSTGSA